jgi:hypothetical protein
MFLIITLGFAHKKKSINYSGLQIPEQAFKNWMQYVLM